FLKALFSFARNSREATRLADENMRLIAVAFERPQRSQELGSPLSSPAEDSSLTDRVSAKQDTYKSIKNSRLNLKNVTGITATIVSGILPLAPDQTVYADHGQVTDTHTSEVMSFFNPANLIAYLREQITNIRMNAEEVLAQDENPSPPEAT